MTSAANTTRSHYQWTRHSWETPPLEIIEYIIDHFHDDQSTLRACALVHRNWVREAQYHLFHTILLDSQVKLTALWHLIEGSPHLIAYIRALRLKAYQHWIGQRRSHETQRWLRDVPQLLARKLGGVRSLHFEHIDWDIVRLDSSFAEEIRHFRDVTALSFYSCNFATFYEFEELITSFPELNKLSLDVVSWRNASVALKGVPHEKRALTRLTQLSIGRFCSPELLFGWYTSVIRPIFLQTLEFEAVENPQDLAIVGKFVRRLGASLEHFKLGCKFDHHPEVQTAFVEYVDLVRSTGLKTLHLAVLDIRNESMLWVPKIIQQIATPRMERLTFDIWLYSPVQLSSPHWNEIAWLLSHARLLSVKEVRFVHRGQLNMDIASKALRTQLHALEERHTLRIQDARPPEEPGSNNWYRV